jgi:hypothetical protein
MFEPDISVPALAEGDNIACEFKTTGRDFDCVAL